ncbi:MAG: putative O-methyltransferase [Bacteroidetes bacterium]|nr:putative O-methyltransferase [Bacteroidota bacterium]
MLNIISKMHKNYLKYLFLAKIQQSAMPNPYFKFKQFTVWHDKCAMKVGTDGVLLGAWADVSNANSVLDIGAGTGLVALMIAQRCNAEILAIEIDNNAAIQATGNKDMSPWGERISIIQADFKTFESNTKFDVIVSNPPYFSNSLLPPDIKRSTARHTNELSYYELFEGVAKLISPKGNFSLIIPADVIDKIVEIAAIFDLYPIRQTNVLPKQDSLPKRVLISFSNKKDVIFAKPNDLIIELARHQYTPEYIELTKEYYLKM